MVNIEKKTSPSEGIEALPDPSISLRKLDGKVKSEHFARLQEITEEVGSTTEQKWKAFHAEMRAISPEHLPELPKSVRDRFEGTTKELFKKGATEARKIESVLPDEVGSISRSIEKGDIDAAKITAWKAADRALKEGGEKARELVGGAAMTQILKPLTEIESIGDLFAALGKVLANLLKFIFAGGKIEEAVDTGKKSAEEVKKAVITSADEGMKKAKEMTPEEKEQLIQKATGGLARDIGKKYFAWAEIGPDKFRRLEAIVRGSFSVDQWQKVATKIVDKGEITIGDMADLLANETKSVVSFVWKIALSGILPVGKIAYDTVETSGRFAVALTLDGLNLPPTVMEMNELSSFLSKHASGAGGEYARDIARIELYRPMGLFYSVLGGITAGLAKTGVALLTDTASGANGFDVAKGVIKADYAKVAEEFEKMEKALGKAAGSPGISEPIKALSTQMETVHRNWKVLAIAKEVDFNHAKFLSHPQLSQVLTATEIEGIKKIGNLEQGLQGVVRAASTRKFVWGFQHGWGSSAGVIDKFARDLDGVQDFQRVLARPDGGGWLRLNKAAEMFKTMKIVRHADMAILHLENADDVAKLKSLHALWPEGLAGFFKALPAASFVASGISVATGPEVSGESTMGQVENALKMALLPIYGSWSLLRNVTVSWNDIKAGKMPELSSMALSSAGAVIFAMEAGRIASGAGQTVRYALDGKALEALKTVGKTAGMHAIDLAHSLGYVTRGFHHTLRAGKPTLGALSKMLASGAEKASHLKTRYAIIAAGVLVAGGAAAAMLEKKTPEEHETELKKNGWLDVLGNPSEKFFGNFGALGNDVKKEVLDTLFSAKVDKQGKNPDVSFDPIHNEYAIVTEKASERDRWQDILDADASFRDQLAKFGIDVKVVSREEIEKLRTLVKKEPTNS